MKDNYVKTILDSDGKPIVVIDNIMFSGKRKIDWDEVEEYLKQYVSKSYKIKNYDEIIYIGNDFPDEFTGSESRKKLKGTAAKAKANATQGIPNLIEIADDRSYEDNRKAKHDSDAKFGWYRYNILFALPVYAENAEVERYNIFSAKLLVRHDSDGKKYLYDIITIKKETSRPLEQ